MKTNINDEESLSAITTEGHPKDLVAIYNAISSDANFADIEIEGDPPGLYADRLERMICEIELFVRRVLINDEVAFKIEKDRNGNDLVRARYLGRKIKMFDKFLSIKSDVFEFSEHVKIFFRACDSMRLHMGYFENPFDLNRNKSEIIKASRFNQLCTEIRRDGRSKATRKKIADRKYSFTRNYKSCLKYEENLFLRYSRLLVLRLDFGYWKGLSKTISLEEARRHLAKFHNSKRWNSIFENVVGYIWKIEYGERKGYHFHLIFFCDGAKVQNDNYLAWQIGKYWEGNVSENKGTHFNCNRSKTRYKRCGIGMVSHFDVEKRAIFLSEVVSYLCKKEQYLKLKLNSKIKTIGKGIVAERSQSGAGRPRSREINRPEKNVLEISY
ncbi:inovirus-type Gp2 protein [Duganella sp. Dugasp56]|uniref:YagK/YfjJ domain-containing protein n=1 Tax=Duganella sp. Dugasp56 TaxID=3243046 RepID=UPI0039AEEC10